MSFQKFIYYCAVCGGWGAFLTWAVARVTGVSAVSSELLQAALTGGLLGGFVAAGVGFVDAVLNAAGAQRLVRVLVCALVGLVGGTIGGLLGQVLYTFLRVPIFVGWVIAGVLIGASVGVFDVVLAMTTGQDSRAAFKKVRNGVYGGLLGGFLGGLPYTFIRSTAALPNSGSTIGLVLLGVSIGLMIGLAQVFLKEAWVKVEEGFRAGRELLLTREETVIGRAEGCDLGLFGDNTIDKTHAKIVRKKNRYELARVGSAGETFVNDEPVGDRPVALRSGDAIRIGKSLLRFGVKT